MRNSSLQPGTIVKAQFSYIRKHSAEQNVELGELLTVKKVKPDYAGCEMFFEEKSIGYWFSKNDLITSVDVVNIFEIAEALCEKS